MRFATNLIPASFILILILSGCGYEECKTDKQFANIPGICGKIHRLEQAKKRFTKGSHQTLLIMIGMMTIPFALVLVFKITRILLRLILMGIEWIFRQK